jgi:hypothetical protein
MSDVNPNVINLPLPKVLSYKIFLNEWKLALGVFGRETHLYNTDGKVSQEQ